MNRILIIGANSDIAKATAEIYAFNGFDLILALRNKKSIETYAKDLEIRHEINIETIEFDVTNFADHKRIYDNIKIKPIGVIYAAGVLEDQKQCERSFTAVLNTINVNFLGAVSILNIIANDFENKKEGFIVGISSVAGERGRASNYIYGASKSAFTSYLSGLRNRLSKSHVHVLTVKPGFVKTKMTQNLKLPHLLTASAIDVARDIYKGQQKQKNILYTKRIWHFVMLVIRLIPENIFKFMKL